MPLQNPAPPAPASHDVLPGLLRAASGADPVGRILRRLAEHTGCAIGLLDASGTLLRASAPGLATVLDSPEAARLLAPAGHGPASAVLDVGEHALVLMALPAPEGHRLAAAGLRPLAPGAARLLSDAAPVVGLAWRLEAAEGTRRRTADAESRTREAVLHLLMSGHTSTARQIAGALLPELPETARVFLVECGPRSRDAVARAITALSGGRAWVVRCPVYADHVVAVVPADADESLDTRITRAVPGTAVGVSHVVALHDTALGYEQAHHARTVARAARNGSARFGDSTDLASLVAPDAGAWAREFLRPLTDYRPARALDPGVLDLIATARSWLSFSQAAANHLRIHRNTLTARVERIGALLGLELGRVGDQAVLGLALRLHALPHTAAAAAARSSSAVTGPQDLRELGAARLWADGVLRPLRAGEPPYAMETVRVWLRNDARVSATASDLGISVPAVRKRLARLEELMACSLLQPPSARHDLWWALAIAEPGAAA